MADHYIVMADVISSRSREPGELMPELRRLVAATNESLGEAVLSPLTITLGDEFQGVVRSLRDAVGAIIGMEEARLAGGLASKLRYVVNYGDIATPLNREIAHGMLGEGLTEAREQLTYPRRGETRFLFDLPDGLLASQLSRLFAVMYSLTRDWKPKDSGLIFDMVASPNNEEVAAKHGRDRTLVYRRRRTLFVEEYRSLREIVVELSEGSVR